MRIKADYPTHAILSEEQSTTYDPADSFTWVVDPVDGTTNFVLWYAHLRESALGYC